MNGIVERIAALNFISVLIVLCVVVSVWQGMARGASRSFRQFSFMLFEAASTVVGLFVAWRAAHWLTPKVPFSDLPMLRFAVVFLIGYLIVKWALLGIGGALFFHRSRHALFPRSRQPSFLSGLSGAGIGALIGGVRALLLMALLFIYTTLFPMAPFAGYVQASDLYQKGVETVFQPYAGELVAKQFPVLAQRFQRELGQMLQRRYELLDSRIPPDVAGAAQEITNDANTDEAKAKELYRWIGTRIQYDWDKVKLYDEQGIWHEQTPEETFRTKKGVCIDYSRLYAVMARSIGLDVRIETGLGYDGRGGYGPHAWNAVYLSERDVWVPLDATWASSGGNWFNSPQFYKTHLKDAA